MDEFHHPDYPGVYYVDGIPMRLVRESRWARVYEHPTDKKVWLISRFHDGSAAITAEELRDGWDGWTERERLDFCQNSSELQAQDDFPQMLRFILKRGTSDQVGMIAQSVARCLPVEEAFRELVDVLDKVDVAEAANIVQGVALTRHPTAEGTLRRYLVDEIWRDPRLGADDAFLNWVAYTATCCIEQLLSLGVSPDELETYARELSSHACAANRDACRRFLGEYYDQRGSEPV